MQALRLLGSRGLYGAQLSLSRGGATGLEHGKCFGVGRLQLRL